MGFIATSMVSWSGILVKRLVTSQERKKISERFSVLIWEKKKRYWGWKKIAIKTGKIIIESKMKQLDKVSEMNH